MLQSVDQPNLRCRHCAQPTDVILDLGESPLANALLSDPHATPAVYPLGLCQCRSCGLVQNVTNLSTDVLFGNGYPYYSGVSKTVQDHFQDLAKHIAAQVPGGAQGLEIGSNDGTLQLALARQAVSCLGLDPADGPVAAACAAGCTAICGTLDDDTSAAIIENTGLLDFVSMSNVLAHVPDPKDLISRVRNLLKPGGLLVIEVQSWLALVQSGSFDMVYHEHHSHFSLSSLGQLLQAAGFGIKSCQTVTAQGGSLRVFCRADTDHTISVRQAIGAEEADLAAGPARIRAHLDTFRASAERFSTALAGRKIAGYGAAAKTVTLLAAANVELDLTCIADRAPSKVNKFLPVGGIPIVTPEHMLATRPEAIVLFSWNLRTEILPVLAGFDVWTPLPALRQVV